MKWILTYTLLARDNGNFKLGPAKAQSGGKIYSSNTVFLTVEGTPDQNQHPHLYSSLLGTSRVRSAREVGDRVLLLLEAGNPQPYRSEGFTVTLKLLSQLPVESLRFLEEQRSFLVFRNTIFLTPTVPAASEQLTRERARLL